MSEIEKTSTALKQFKDQLADVNAKIIAAREAVKAAYAGYAAAVAANGNYEAAKKAQDVAASDLGHLQARASYLEGEIANATVAFERVHRWAATEFADARQARAEADKLAAQAAATQAFADARYADADRDLGHAAELGLPEAIHELDGGVK
jgi:hypothetical protein